MDKETRDKSIYDMYISGINCNEIGKKHGLTKQRVIQIAKALGAKGRVYEPAENELGWNICKVDGCGRVVRSRWATLCNKHYFRGRRTGTTRDRDLAGYNSTNHGYMAKHNKSHPAASPNGTVYEHRAVFYENHGKDGHKCFWCNKELIWGGVGNDKLVIDHLDGNKHNNNIENLRASCPICNQQRGLMMTWFVNHKDDPVIRKILCEDCNLGKSNIDDTDFRF